MTNQNDRYLKQPRNRNVWMYQRAIPADVQMYHGGRKTINRSCETEKKSKARIIRDKWSEADMGFWNALRDGRDEGSIRKKYEAALVISDHLDIAIDDPITFQEANERNQVGRLIQNNQKIKQLTNPENKTFSREELPKVLKTNKIIRQ